MFTLKVNSNSQNIFRSLLLRVEIYANAEKQLSCTALPFFIPILTPCGVQALYWPSAREIFTDCPWKDCRILLPSPPPPLKQNTNDFHYPWNLIYPYVYVWGRYTKGDTALCLPLFLKCFYFFKVKIFNYSPISLYGMEFRSLKRKQLNCLGPKFQC